MLDFPSNLRIVAVEAPYDNWNDPRMADLYRDLVSLKLRGYGCEYPYGILPVDGADLISTHLILARENKDKLEPFMGIRFTSHTKSRLHFSNFPGMSLLEQAGATDHIQSLKNVIQAADARGAEIFYCGSLSIDPSERGQKERARYYRELLTTMYVGYLEKRGPTELFAGGTVRFKIDRWLSEIGHHPLSLNGNDLDSIQVRHLAQEEVRPMHMRTFSEAALSTAAKHWRLWQNRVQLGDPQLTPAVVKPTEEQVSALGGRPASRAA